MKTAPVTLTKEDIQKLKAVKEKMLKEQQIVRK